jgi:hypothetical protein
MFEQSFQDMLRLLSGEAPPPSEIPPEVIEAAKKAGVLDLLGRDRAVRAALGKDGNAFLYQAVLGSASLRELERLAGILAGKKIPVVVLKGMAYALMFEKGGPTRSMADIDLLVPKEGYKEACRLVLEQGYRELVPNHPMSKHRGQYNERTFVKGEVVFDVHQSFLIGERIAVDYKGLWERTRPAGDECPDCRLLSPEDTFLFHCFHMGFNEFIHGLRPVWELRRLLLLDRPDLAIAARRARQWGTLSMTWCALRLLEICFSENIGSGFTVHGSRLKRRPEEIIEKSSGFPPGRRPIRAGGTVHGSELKRRPEEIMVKKSEIDLFKPVLPRAKILERFVVKPSLMLMQDISDDHPPGRSPLRVGDRPPTLRQSSGPSAADRRKRMTRKVQLFRKALMVDRPVGAAKYFLLWIKGNTQSKMTNF